MNYRHTFPCGCRMGFENEDKDKFVVEACSENHLALLQDCMPVMMATSEARLR